MRFCFRSGTILVPASAVNEICNILIRMWYAIHHDGFGSPEGVISRYAGAQSGSDSGAPGDKSASRLAIAKDGAEGWRHSGSAPPLVSVSRRGPTGCGAVGAEGS